MATIYGMPVREKRGDVHIVVPFSLIAGPSKMIVMAWRPVNEKTESCWWRHPKLERRLRVELFGTMGSDTVILLAELWDGDLDEITEWEHVLVDGEVSDLIGSIMAESK